MAEPYGTIAKYKKMGQIEKHNEQVRAWAAPMALDVAAIFWATWRGIEKRLPEGNIETDEEKFHALTQINRITDEEVIKQTPNMWACLAEYERKVFLAGAVEQCRRMNNYSFLSAREPLREAFIPDVNIVEADSLTMTVGTDDDGWVNVPNQRAVDYATEHAAEMVTAIDETTRSEINQIIVNATNTGTSYTDIAKKIKEKFTEFSVPKPQQHISNRATLVAVTELGNAYCAGNMEVGHHLEDAGLDMMKIWSTCEDDRVSDGCNENADAGWIPLDDDFPSGDQYPPRFPGCRCDILQDMLDEAALGKSYDEYMDMDTDDKLTDTEHSVEGVGAENVNLLSTKEGCDALLNIHDEYGRFEYAVQMNGGDGLPTVISEDQLRDDVLYRGVGAENMETLQQYKDQFVGGDWYNTCAGGRMFGYGTYSSGLVEVADEFAERNGEGSAYYIEKMQLKENAKLLDTTQGKGLYQVVEEDDPGCLEPFYDALMDNNPTMREAYKSYDEWINDSDNWMYNPEWDISTFAAATGYDAVYCDGKDDEYVIVNRAALEVVR